MKTLKESLFDKDLVEREINFGGTYVPVEILFSSTENCKQIGDSLNISKLKKDANPLSLNGVDGYDQYEKYLTYLPYVLAKVAKLPLEDKFESVKTDMQYNSYCWKLTKMFRDYQKSIKNPLIFIMMKWDGTPILQIRKTHGYGLIYITIKYKQK